MPLDPATTAYLAAMTVQPNSNRQTRIDNLITGLKADGIWAKLDKLFVHAAHDSQAGLVNAIDPSKVATVNGTPPFTTDGGYAGDGTATSYLDLASAFAFTGANFTQNSATLGFWITVQGNTGNHRIMGDPTIVSLMSARTDGLGESAFVNSSTSGRTSPHLSSSKVGHRTVVRTASNACAIYFNGSSVGTNTNASVAPATGNGTILQVGGQGGMTDTVSFTYSGGALTGTDMSNLHSRLNTYLTNLSSDNNGSASGATLTETLSLAAGAATGDASAGGAALTETLSLAAGAAAADGNASGTALTETLSLSAGAASSSGAGSAPGAALTITESLASGSATGSASASGAALSLAETISSGAGTGTAQASGSALSEALSVSGGSAAGNGQAQGCALTISVGLTGGAATGTGAASGCALAITYGLSVASSHPPVTTPSNRRLGGLVTARRTDGSTPSRRIAPNLQPRRAAH